MPKLLPLGLSAGAQTLIKRSQAGDRLLNQPLETTQPLRDLSRSNPGSVSSTLAAGRPRRVRRRAGRQRAGHFKRECSVQLYWRRRRFHRRAGRQRAGHFKRERCVQLYWRLRRSRRLFQFTPSPFRNLCHSLATGLTHFPSNVTPFFGRLLPSDPVPRLSRPSNISLG
jgi:hypothetical protein